MVIIDFNWNFLPSLDRMELTPWTHLWRKASYYYAHDQQFWAIANALLVGLAAVAVLLLVGLVSCIRRKFTEITTLESEQQLLLALEAVKLIDENQKHLQGISNALKHPVAEAAEQSVISRASFGLQNRGLSKGRGRAGNNR